MSSFFPALMLLLGAVPVPFLRGRFRTAYLLVLPIAGFLNLLGLEPGTVWEGQFLGYSLTFAKVDKLSLVFGYVFHIVTWLGTLFIIHRRNNFEACTGLVYGGAAIGVVFAGDLFTLFVFWEMLTVSAALLIWGRKTPAAVGAGFRYLLYHVGGGLVLLSGIILWVSETGDVAFDFMGVQGLSTLLIYLGFGVNAAWPLLHPWLTDSYPNSTEGGAVFLSALTTKSAVYVLVRGFTGEESLIWIGCVMLTFPVFYAVIENNLRKVLSYSLINQVGFMMVGIGIGTELSVNGAVAHAFTHIIYKALLFMSMGAVLYQTGKIKCTQLGGLYKSMPITCWCCIIGAASISGVPFLSGFVSKSMIVSAAAEGHLFLVWLTLLFASAGVLEHAGIKVPFFAFFSHDSGIRVKEAPRNMLCAMGVAVFLCIFVGLFPGMLYRILPYATEYSPYTWEHVLSQLQLLGFAGLAFAVLVLAGFYPPEIRSVNLDFDWFYRKGARLFYRVADVSLNSMNNFFDRVFIGRIVGSLSAFFQDAPRRLVLMVLVPLWKASGLTMETVGDKSEVLSKRFTLGAFPIGYAAIWALTLLLILYLL